MNNKIKLASIMLVPFTLTALTGCGAKNVEQDNKVEQSSTVEPGNNAEQKEVEVKDEGQKAAEAYVGAYLNKDVNYDEAGVSKDAVQDIVLKRNYNIIKEYSNNSGKDKEILNAYYEALKNVEYTAKVSTKENDQIKTVVTVKGIDISGISDDLASYRIKVRREKKPSKDELKALVDDKAVEDLKAAQIKGDIDIELVFVKDEQGKLKLSDNCIGKLENAISYSKDDYANNTDAVPDEIKQIEIAK